MKTIEFDLERTIAAPIGQVFARLTDINGHNTWVNRQKSMLKSTRQTSPGQPGVGTTYEDDTKQGVVQGEIVEFDAPNRVVYHWWDTSRNGRLKYEGWPGYTLEAAGENTTVVRHHAKLTAYGIYTLAAPIFRLLVSRERTATVDALKASFESGSSSAAR